MTGHQQIKTKQPWLSMQNEVTQAIVGSFAIDVVVIVFFCLVIA